MNRILGHETPRKYTALDPFLVSCDFSGLFSDVLIPDIRAIRGSFCLFSSGPFFVSFVCFVVSSLPVKKLILWDIDGTLIVSHGAGIRAMERALTKHFGVKCDLRKIDWAGRTDSWITGEVFRHTGIPDTPQNSHEYLEAYLELLPQELRASPQGQVLPGILSLLDTLQPAGQATPLLQAVRAVWQAGGVVAGTSSGAAVLSTLAFRDAPEPLRVM